MHEASFELRHECPYRAFSERFPGVTIREYHRQDCQVLEVTGDGPDREAVVAALDDIGTVLHTSTDGDGLYVVARSCRCPIEGSILERFQEHNCVHVPPVEYRHGWEQYTVLGFAASDVHDLLGDLDEDREIDVLSTTSIEERTLPHSSLVSIDRLFADLTDRQLAALQLALDHGYYEQPRGASTAELAEYTDVARATYEEHLRKAENKLLGNVEQFVRLVTETGAGNVLGTPRSRSTLVADD